MQAVSFCKAGVKYYNPTGHEIPEDSIRQEVTYF
jgi:hypothetical protein